MDDSRAINIVVNDLDSLHHRIEDLPAHPALTSAGDAVQEAKRLVQKAIVEIHRADMRSRYGVA